MAYDAEDARSAVVCGNTALKRNLSGSPAEKAGLRTGMIIQEVERKAVKNIDILKNIVNEMDTAKGILLLVTTSGGSRYIFIQEEKIP